MAIRKSSRSRRSRVRPVGPALIPSSRLQSRVVGRAAFVRPAIPSVEGRRQLTTLAQRLRLIYGFAVVAERALRHQAAEQDIEIADCLRAGVCDPLADQARDLEPFIERSWTTPP
jgi:hypothetical protein